jgi:hypothetical protein
VIKRICVGGLIKRFGGLILTNSSEVVYNGVILWRMLKYLVNIQ